jgi:hypothetical protein
VGSGVTAGTGSRRLQCSRAYKVMDSPLLNHFSPSRHQHQQQLQPASIFLEHTNTYINQLPSQHTQNDAPRVQDPQPLGQDLSRRQGKQPSSPRAPRTAHLGRLKQVRPRRRPQHARRRGRAPSHGPRSALDDCQPHRLSNLSDHVQHHDFVCFVVGIEDFLFVSAPRMIPICNRMEWELDHV